MPKKCKPCAPSLAPAVPQKACFTHSGGGALPQPTPPVGVDGIDCDGNTVNFPGANPVVVQGVVLTKECPSSKYDFEIGCSSIDGRPIMAAVSVDEAGTITQQLLELDGNGTPVADGSTLVSCNKDYEKIDFCFRHPDDHTVEYTKSVWFDADDLTAPIGEVWFDNFGLVIPEPPIKEPCSEEKPDIADCGREGSGEVSTFRGGVYDPGSNNFSLGTFTGFDTFQELLDALSDSGYEISLTPGMLDSQILTLKGAPDISPLTYEHLGSLRTVTIEWRDCQAMLVKVCNQTDLSTYETECEKEGEGLVFTLFSKYPQPHPDAASYGVDFVWIGEVTQGSGSLHPTLGFDVGNYNVYATCADALPADDSNGHIWIPDAPSTYTGITYNSTPNADPENCASTTEKSLLVTLCNTPTDLSKYEQVCGAGCEEYASLTGTNNGLSVFGAGTASHGLKHSTGSQATTDALKQWLDDGYTILIEFDTGEIAVVDTVSFYSPTNDTFVFLGDTTQPDPCGIWGLPVDGSSTQGAGVTYSAINTNAQEDPALLVKICPEEPVPDFRCEVEYFLGCDDVNGDGSLIVNFLKPVESCFTDGALTSQTALPPLSESLDPYTVISEVACDPASFPFDEEFYCDTGATPPQTFIRRTVFVAGTGAVVEEVELDGVTPYTVVGAITQGSCPIPKIDPDVTPCGRKGTAQVNTSANGILDAGSSAFALGGFTGATFDELSDDLTAGGYDVQLSPYVLDDGTTVSGVSLLTVTGDGDLSPLTYTRPTGGVSVELTWDACNALVVKVCNHPVDALPSPLVNTECFVQQGSLTTGSTSMVAVGTNAPFVNIGAGGDSVSAGSTTFFSWNGGMVDNTNNIPLGTDGEVTYVYRNQTGSGRGMLGLINAANIPNLSANGSWVNLSNAFYLYEPLNQIYIYQNGSFASATGVTFSTGDLFVIRVTGGVVEYLHNGSVIYTSANVPVDDLHPAGSFAAGANNVFTAQDFLIESSKDTIRYFMQPYDDCTWQGCDDDGNNVSWTGGVPEGLTPCSSVTNEAATLPPTITVATAGNSTPTTITAGNTLQIHDVTQTTKTTEIQLQVISGELDLFANAPNGLLLKRMGYGGALPADYSLNPMDNDIYQSDLFITALTDVEIIFNVHESL